MVCNGPQKSYSLVFQSNVWWLVEFWFKVTFLPRILGISSTQDEIDNFAQGEIRTTRCEI